MKKLILALLFAACLFGITSKSFACGVSPVPTPTPTTIPGDDGEHKVECPDPDDGD